MTAPITPATPTTISLVDAAPPTAAGRTQRWNIHDAESSVGVESAEAMATFRSRVRRFRGYVTSRPDRLIAEFDLRSLENPSRVVTAVIQEDYLETDTHPFARVDVVIDHDEANGTLELHGVRRSIRFPITIERSPARVRVRSAFTLKRHDFGIVKLSGMDWIAREEVAIAFDIVAAPERVSVEEIEERK